MQYLNRNLFPALLLAVFLFGTLKVKSADPIDSLTIRIEQAGEDTNKVNLLRALAIHHLTVTGEYDQAILYYNKMIELSKNIDYPYGVARAYKGIGNTYLVQGDFYLAVDNYYEAWGIARENNLRRTESTLINNIGLLY